MKCTRCGTELRYGTEQVGLDNNNIPVYHRFSYCDTCRMKWDIDIMQANNIEQKNNGKLKDSTLSIVSCAMAAVTCILPIPAILSVPLIVSALIIGIIDLCKKNKSERHIGSYFTIVFGIIAIVLLF